MVGLFRGPPGATATQKGTTVKITAWHLNALLTAMLNEASPLAPPTWAATKSATDAVLEDRITGLFFWQNQQEVRTLTEDSASTVGRVLIKGLDLDVTDYRFERVRGGGEIRILYALSVRAFALAPTESEVWSLIAEASALLLPSDAAAA